MSIFQTLPAIPWSPIVGTAAPMTVTGITINAPTRYGLHGGWCFYSYNISLTIGGTLGVQSININFPVNSQIVTAALAVTGSIANGGVGSWSRALTIFSAQQIQIFKNNGAGDVAWLAGATVLLGTGFYPLF